VEAVASGAKAEPTVVFFGSLQFTPQDLELLKHLRDRCEANVKFVAVGPANNPRLVLQAVHSGAIDFLDINADLGIEVRTIMGRLKVTPGDGSTQGRLFAIVPVSGGSGASMLAINLAAAIAQKQSECCLLDLCLRGGDLATLLKVKPRYTLLSLAGKAQQFDKAMFDQALVKHECGVHLLASPEPYSNFRQINPQLIQQVVQFSRARFANVVAELEDMDHAEQVRTLAQADRVIVPLRLDFVALSRAKLCIDLLCTHIPRERVTLVACGVGQPNELPADSFAEVLGLPVKHRIRYDPAAVNSAVNLGMPLVAASPRAKASLGILGLADALTGDGAECQPERAPRSSFTFRSAVNWLGLATS